MKRTKKYTWDISKSLGESAKLLRDSTLRQMRDYQANNLKRFGSSNGTLRRTMKFHKKVEKMFVGNDDDEIEEEEDFTDFDKYTSKIVAKKSFFLNPNENNPKIIKTKNKLYVV